MNAHQRRKLRRHPVVRKIKYVPSGVYVWEFNFSSVVPNHSGAKYLLTGSVVL